MRSFGSPASPQPHAPQQPVRPFPVVLVHTDEVVRFGLESLLQSLPHVSHVASTAQAPCAKALISTCRPGVVVLPTSIPAPEWADIAEHAARHSARVLALLRNPDTTEALDPSRAKADGYLLEQGLTADLLTHAFARLDAGEMPVPPTLLRRVLAAAARTTHAAAAHTPRLTPRENATLALLVEGFSNKQIARRLNISEHGAKRHVANVLAKLNCPNRTLAVATALREGIVQPTGLQ
jgi:two-component system, NarL family, nitrate/nitrite response regulator NarL